MHVGQKIKQLVEKKEKLTHKDFALLIGHTEQSLHGIYKKESIQVDLLFTICEKLNITVSDFFEQRKFSGVSEPLVEYGKSGKVTYKISEIEALHLDTKAGKMDIILKKKANTIKV